MSVTDQLVTFAESHVPEEAARMMRLSLFDWAACGIMGAREPDFAAFVAAEKAKGGGAALVIGGGVTAPATAALLNGTLSHALDYDDTHFAHIGHPSVAVVPAVLALSVEADADMAGLVDAATVGVEASIHVGLWLGRGHYQVGYHQTATAGAFGATLAAARILQLSQVETRMALGLCASLASGLKAQFGTMAKPLNAGLAARSGVEAALWAGAGVTAAADGLAGPLGFGATHHGEFNAGEIGQGDWRIGQISHKFHACCHGLHATLEALAEIDAAPEVISGIDISTHPRWMSVCNIAEPSTGLEAKFSYAQVAAMALTGRDTGAIASFDDAVTHAPDVVQLRGLVTVTPDETLTETQAQVVVHRKSGSPVHAVHDLSAPISLDQRTAKLRRKADALLGADRSAALWQVSQGDDLAAFADQLVRS